MAIRKNFFLLLSALTLLSSCASQESPEELQKSQLELRAAQTRTYDTKDIRMVMKAALNTLQDDGYIVKNASFELGYISASKEIDLERRFDSFMSAFSGRDYTYNKNQQLEATVNVSDHGEQTQVRVTFQQKVLNNAGYVVNVKQVKDLKFYQDFFEKTSKSIFVQSEGL